MKYRFVVAFNDSGPGAIPKFIKGYGGSEGDQFGSYIWRRAYEDNKSFYRY